MLLNELGVDRSGVATLIDAKRRRIVFQGAVDDQSDYEHQKPAATRHFLADAITALVAGRPVAVPVADSLGCLMTPLTHDQPLAGNHYAAQGGARDAREVRHLSPRAGRRAVRLLELRAGAALGGDDEGDAAHRPHAAR